MSNANFFDRAKDFVINGGTFNIINDSPETGTIGFDSLCKHVAYRAAYDSQPESRCDPHTCEAVLKAVKEWVTTSTQRVLWLHGPAGSGKSTIAQTISDDYAKRTDHQLAASFFFSSTVSDQNTEMYLMPTIALHLCLSIPSAKPFILRAVENDPTVFSKSLKARMQALIIGPLIQAAAMGGSESWPQLVIIDGINECSTEIVQHRLVQTIMHTMLQDRTL